MVKTKYIDVLDTCVLYSSSSWYLESPQIQTLLVDGPEAGISIVVPEVVLDELVFLYQKELSNVVSGLNDNVKKLTALVSKVGDSMAVNVEEFDPVAEVKSYRQLLLEAFDKHSIKLIAYPRVSHSDLVRKASLRSKPFNEKGEGYKDALVWASFLSQVVPSGQSEYWFVSANVADFFSNDRQLHSELVSEVIAKGVDSNRVRAVIKVKDVIEQLISPFQESSVRRSRISAMFLDLQQGWPRIRLINILEEAVTTLVHETIPSDFGLPSEAIWIDGFEVEDISDPQELVVVERTHGEYFVSINVAAQINFDCTFSQSSIWDNHRSHSREQLALGGIGGEFRLPTRWEFAMILQDVEGIESVSFESYEVVLLSSPTGRWGWSPAPFRGQIETIESDSDFDVSNDSP